jgi:6-phospho-3-hexuloisomerase
MHLGFTVYFVGEPTTPSIRENDLIIIGSGSGRTSGLVNMAKKAKSEKAQLATITIHPKNPIGTMADALIQIPGISTGDKATEKAPSIQPNGSSFEQLSWLVYDSLIVDLKKELRRIWISGMPILNNHQHRAYARCSLVREDKNECCIV